jgi:hypothetical protein
MTRRPRGKGAAGGAVRPVAVGAPASKR